MAKRKKVKGKAKVRRKKAAVGNTTRRKTVRKAATRKKIAKKAPPHPPSSTKTKPSAKTAGNATPIAERAPNEVRCPPSRPAQPVSPEQRIGVVTHYYSHLSVASMRLEPGATLRVDDVIHIRGHTTDFTQKVESLEVDHASVTDVGQKDDFALKVIDHAREHDVVFKVRP